MASTSDRMNFETFLIDANALVSFFTGRIAKQTAIVSDYIVAASNLDCRIIVTQGVVNDLVFVLQGVYHRDADFVSGVLRDLSRNAGEQIVHGFFLDRLFFTGRQVSNITGTLSLLRLRKK